MTRRLFFITICCLLISINLTACASGPKLIAVQPVNQIAASSFEQAYQFNAELEIEVWNVEAATEEVCQLVYNLDGYIEDSQAYHAAGWTFSRMEISVPNRHFEDLNQDLAKLGRVIHSYVITNQVKSGLGRYPSNTSYLTLIIRSRQASRVQIIQPGWNPLRTLHNAIDVSINLFSFLINLAIWVLVVTGPFFLIGWLAFRAYKRMKR